jgi:phenylacetate-CoA ligase
MESLDSCTLQKKGLRTDAIWSKSFFYNQRLLRLIPFYLDTRALMASQYWQRVSLDYLRDTRLQELFTHAFNNIPIWRDQFTAAGVSGAEHVLVELEKLPIISKKDFWKDGFATEYYIYPPLLARSTAEQTSGSTNRPFTFYHDDSFLLRSFAMCERLFQTLGKGVRYPVVSVRAYERPGFAFRKYKFFHTKSYNSLQIRFDELTSVIHSFRQPVIIFGFSSWIIEIARLLRQNGQSFPLQSVLAAGEELTHEKRQELERAFGVPVYMYYAASELGRLAFECEFKNLHLNEEWGYTEIVDGRGVPLPFGSQGRIVVTLFENKVMPFIRYDTGDLGSMSSKPCVCGRTLRTLRLLGRQVHVLTFPDGRTTSLLDATAVFHEETIVRQFQLIRTGDYSFTVRIVAGPEFDEEKDELKARFTSLVHLQTTVEWELVSTIEPSSAGKFLYFIDARQHV